jgi:hypothetical protein
MARKLRKEVSSVIETTPAMIYKPIAAIDKSLEMLYYHFGQQDGRASKRYLLIDSAFRVNLLQRINL